MCTTYVRNTCPRNAHVYHPHNQRSVHCFITSSETVNESTRPVGEGIEGPQVKSITCRRTLLTSETISLVAASHKRQLESGPSAEEGYDVMEEEVDASGRRKSPRPRHLVLARQHSSTSSDEGMDKDMDRYDFNKLNVNSYKC